jgi:hypothetical protein
MLKTISRLPRAVGRMLLRLVRKAVRIAAIAGAVAAVLIVLDAALLGDRERPD